MAARRRSRQEWKQIRKQRPSDPEQAKAKRRASQEQKKQVEQSPIARKSTARESRRR